MHVSLHHLGVHLQVTWQCVQSTMLARRSANLIWSVRSSHVAFKSILSVSTIENLSFLCCRSPCSFLILLLLPIRFSSVITLIRGSNDGTATQSLIISILDYHIAPISTNKANCRLITIVHVFKRYLPGIQRSVLDLNWVISCFSFMLKTESQTDHKANHFPMIGQGMNIRIISVQADKIFFY